MMTTTTNLTTRAATLGALLLALAGFGCSSSGGPPPTGADQRRLEVVGSSDRVLNQDREDVLEVRYIETDGTRIRDAVVDFAIEGRAGGASLSVSAARTNDVGLARVTVQSADTASFDVVAVAPNAAPVTVRYDVRHMDVGDLDYTVTYPGVRRLATVEAALFTNTTCASLRDRVPSPRDAQRPRLDRRESFRDVQMGMPMAIFALGLSGTDNVAADGCTDVRLEEHGQHEVVTLEDTGAAGGYFEVEEVYDFRNGSLVLQILDAFLGLSSDPAGWLVEFVHESGIAPSWLESALDFAPTRVIVISVLEDALKDVLPWDYDERLRDVHDDFRAALGELTLIGELEWDAHGIARADEFGEGTDRVDYEGTHRISRLVMPMVTDRPLEYRVNAQAEIMVGVEGQTLMLPEHELNLPIGHYVRRMLEQVLLPRLPGSPDTIRGFVENMFDCHDIAATFGFEASYEEDLARETCEVGVAVVGDAMDRWVRDLARNGVFLVGGTAELDDRDGDYVDDEIFDGDLDARWLSDAEDMSFAGTMTGDRMSGGSRHPVLRRIREIY